VVTIRVAATGRERALARLVEACVSSRHTPDLVVYVSENFVPLLLYLPSPGWPGWPAPTFALDRFRINGLVTVGGLPVSVRPDWAGLRFEIRSSEVL
jgi:hypothetical protein